MKQTSVPNTDNNSKSQLSKKSDGSNSSKWQVKKLGELCEIELGKTPYRGDKSLWDSKKETDNVWLSIADLLNTEGKIVYDSKEYITDKAVKTSKVVKKGTLLVSFKLTLGRLAFTGRDLFTNEAIAALSIKNEDLLDKDFLYQVLSNFDWARATEGDMKVKGKTLNKAKLKEIPIPLPPLAEQKRIVAILDQAFGEIEKVKVNTEQNLKNAKELFQSYLQLALSPSKSDALSLSKGGVFDGSTSSPTNGADWEENKLGEVCEFRNGAAHEKQITEEGEYILINSKFISSDGKKYKKTDKALAPLSVGEVAFVMSDVPNGKALAKCFLIDKDNLYTLNQRIGVISSKEFIPEFLVYQFNRNKYLLSFDNGENQTNLRKGDILNCPLLIPPLSEQKAIVQRLDALRAETQRLESIYRDKLLNLEELKKSILQKAFSGEL